MCIPRGSETIGKQASQLCLWAPSAGQGTEITCVCRDAFKVHHSMLLPLQACSAKCAGA